MSGKKEKGDILEPFRVARKLEEEGKQFFVETARRTQSPLARQTFQFLANEEDRHIEKIDRFYRSLETAGGDDYPDVEESDTEAKLTAFNDRLATLKSESERTETDAEAYRLALKFENGAEDFYSQKMAETDNPQIKKFYRWLIDEEKMHSRLLKSCLKFVEDPAEWFKNYK
jgi:rubrerythrin